MNKKLDEALSRFGTGNASIFIEPDLADLKFFLTPVRSHAFM
jgi:hypothetical protein